MTDMMNMTVTTLDLHTGYEVVGPVCGSCREQSDPDQGFLQALREIRKSAALLQADAVIGMRQTCVPMADGTGRFHVQLYGTAVRKTAQAQADAAGGAAAMGMMPGGAAGLGQNGRQEGDFLMDGSTLVRYIGQSEYVRVPDGVINIGAEAFHNARVVSVELPDSVTELGNDAFERCGALRSVHVGSGVKSLSSSLFASCSSLTDVELSEGLETLERYSFCWCSALEHLTLPSTVKDIATEAFWCCLELKDIELNSGLESIGPQCFYQCEKLDNVVIPDTVTSIGEKAFFECTSLKEIVIPADRLSNVKG